MEYEYWHVITKINPNLTDKEKGELKVGLNINNQYRKEGRWEFMNMKTGESHWKFEVDYIGRLQKGLSKEERLRQIGQLMNEYNENKKKPIDPETLSLVGNCLTLITESYMKPGSPINGLKEWAEDVITRESIIDPASRDEDDSEYMDSSEFIDEYGIEIIPLFLFEKGYITEAQLKELMQGQSYQTCCYGEYIKRLEKKLGLKINEHEKKAKTKEKPVETPQ